MTSRHEPELLVAARLFTVSTTVKIITAHWTEADNGPATEVVVVTVYVCVLGGGLEGGGLYWLGRKISFQHLMCEEFLTGFSYRHVMLTCHQMFELTGTVLLF